MLVWVRLPVAVSYNESFRVVLKTWSSTCCLSAWELLCQPVVYVNQSEQTQAAVTVLGVSPRKEDVEVGTRFLRIGEAPRV